MKRQLIIESIGITSMHTSSKEPNLLISISSPIALIQQGFQDYIAMLLSFGKKSVRDLGTGLDYDVYPFLNQMLKDIFNDYNLIYNGNRFTHHDIPPSTQILIDSGMEKEYAIRLALIVFQTIVDEIVTFVPDINFNSDGYRFTIVEGEALFVERLADYFGDS